MQERLGAAEDEDLVRELPRAHSEKENCYRYWKRRIGGYNGLWQFLGQTGRFCCFVMSSAHVILIFCRKRSCVLLYSE